MFSGKLAVYGSPWLLHCRECPSARTPHSLCEVKSVPLQKASELTVLMVCPFAWAKSLSSSFRAGAEPWPLFSEWSSCFTVSVLDGGSNLLPSQLTYPSSPCVEAFPCKLGGVWGIQATLFLAYYAWDQTVSYQCRG